MKATMNGEGVITIESENGAEAFALRIWASKSAIPINDMERVIPYHINPSWIVIDASDPSEDSV